MKTLNINHIKCFATICALSTLTLLTSCTTVVEDKKPTFRSSTTTSEQTSLQTPAPSTTTQTRVVY